MRKLSHLILLPVAVLSVVLALVPAVPVHAADANDFSLQVTPSPLVTTMHPGDKTVLELKIRNGGTSTENLKIEPRAFKIDVNTGKVNIQDTTPPDVAKWISFSQPTFTIVSGQWLTQKVTIALPKDAGFSYSFALLISRQSQAKPTSGGRLIKGSVAVFTLVSVDRPGATRKLDVAQFASSKRVYEYLPAQFDLKLKNTGNSIVQPFGNVFIQRGSKGSPISVLPVNDQHGYFLPGVQRNLNMEWSSGFPHYKTATNSDGSTSNKLVWNWSDMSKFRIGRYTANLVAVYNDGGHDVPIEGQVSFWVIPWKILLGVLLFTLLMLFGLWSLVRKIISIVRKVSGKTTKPKADQQ